MRSSYLVYTVYVRECKIIWNSINCKLRVLFLVHAKREAFRNVHWFQTKIQSVCIAKIWLQSHATYCFGHKRCTHAVFQRKRNAIMVWSVRSQRSCRQIFNWSDFLVLKYYFKWLHYSAILYTEKKFSVKMTDDVWKLSNSNQNWELSNHAFLFAHLTYSRKITPSVRIFSILVGIWQFSNVICYFDSHLIVSVFSADSVTMC